MDPSRIPDDAWEFEGMSGDGLRRTYVHWIDKAKGLGFRKTENLVERELLEANRQEYDDSFGKRFGDGRVVARIPLNVYFQQFPQRLKEGDRDFVKWFLNHPSNKPYRTFRGHI